MNASLNSLGGQQWFQELNKWEETRCEELTKMFSPYISLTADYAMLVCRVIQVMGQKPPASAQDASVRDLAADVYDYLRESERIIMAGKNMLVYPMARRAYESLSLMVLLLLDTKYVKKWTAGQQIGNKEIREQLNKHKFGEQEQALKSLYNFFSAAAHPNRETVAQRFLGEGNSFTLGVMAKPDLLVTVDFCIHNLDLWFWFAASLAWHHRELIDKFDPSFGQDYLSVAKRVGDMKNQLIGELDRLKTST
jgi:hypothetical protein